VNTSVRYVYVGETVYVALSAIYCVHMGEMEARYYLRASALVSDEPTGLYYLQVTRTERNFLVDRRSFRGGEFFTGLPSRWDEQDPEALFIGNG
jgi:hypothetical protein